jgi:hypothetical protein
MGEPVQNTRLKVSRLWWGALLALAAGAAFADEQCDYKWDVTHERALFAGAAQSQSAATDAASAPTVAVDRLYELSLTPQDKVQFALPPAKKSPAPASQAGLVKFTAGSAGTYRISIDGPFWLDVVADGKALANADFQGQPNCHSPRKIVIFMLPATPVLVQVSGAPGARVRLAITASQP